MLARVTPGVVNIAVRGRVREQNPLLQDPFFRRFFDLPQNAAAAHARDRRRPVRASSSMPAADYVLTNGHVVENATKIEVTTKDNRRFTAKLIGRDPDTDIAVLQIPPDNLTAVPLGDSDRLRGRRFRAGDRQPVRARTDRDLGHRQRARPQRARHRGLRGFHPDRRLDQPRQLGRAARSTSTASASASTPRSWRPAAAISASASPCRSTWRAASWTS